MARRVYYFGRWDQPGHGFHHPGGRSAFEAWDVVPWGTSIDARLIPKEKRYSLDVNVQQPEGVAHLLHLRGWTALAWWDRSADSRGNSSSVFVFEDVLDYDTAMARARRLFPEVFARITYDVVPAEPVHA